MAQKVKEPRELFLHDLGSMLKIEKDQAKALPRMQKATNDSELRDRLEQHVRETREQANRIQQVFKQLGTRAEQGPSAGVEALQQEFKESSASVAKELADVVTVGVAARVEHYEIAAYETLIEMARALGERDVAKLLNENLNEEKAMLRDGQKAARRLAKAAAKAA